VFLFGGVFVVYGGGGSLVALGIGSVDQLGVFYLGLVGLLGEVGL
jgi:hypothetical protein